MPRLTHALLIPALIVGASTAQQGPDVLVPSAWVDGCYALVDKDKDGKYTTVGENWDFVKSLQASAPTNYVLDGKKIFFSCVLRDKIMWVEDADGDGLINDTTERHTYYDIRAGIGAAQNVSAKFITMGKNGWLFWINDLGTGEGVYRSKDMNNDGDAEDPNETVPVLDKTMPRVQIENAPLTKAMLNGVNRTLLVNGLQRILFDSTYGTNGRFLVEDEWTDQILAFEDKNNDNDFSDTGECYLFCALYDGKRANVIDLDVNPDVTAGKLPNSIEIRDMAVDFTTKTYYFISGQTTATAPDASIIFKAKDGNNDGDVNDAGETTIFWDGSLDSTGATKAYNHVYGMWGSALAGVLYVLAEWDAPYDREHLIKVQDKNNDGDANDVGETTVLWILPRDANQFSPAIFPSGTLATLKVQTQLTRIYNYGGPTTCVSSLNNTANKHIIYWGMSNANYGKAASGMPHLGNTKWLVRTARAKELANGALAIGVSKLAAGFALDPGGTCKIFHSYDFVEFFFTTDATGVNDKLLAIPNLASLNGLRTYWSSIVVDATASAGLGFTLSNAFDAKIGDWTYSR
jgi:hypothetical protein